MLEKIVTFSDRLSDTLGRAVAWLAIAMVVLTGAVVVLRYGLEIGSIALQESITYLHASVFLLGAGYTLRHDGHVRVDIFYRRMSARGRALVNLLGSLLLLLPVSGFIAWASWDYVAVSWQMREDSQEAGGLPYVYLLKSLILVLAGILILQGLTEILRNILVLRKGLKADAEPEETLL